MRPAPLVLSFAWISTATAFLLLADSPYVIGALGGIAFLLGPAVNAIAFTAIANYGCALLALAIVASVSRGLWA